MQQLILCRGREAWVEKVANLVGAETRPSL
jgi:hypothetical protein